MGFQETFKALADPTRREILNLLKQGPLPAGDIVEKFDSSGATISHHLSLLKKAGLISDRKEGKFIYYELNMTVFEEVLAWISTFKGEENKDEK